MSILFSDKYIEIDKLRFNLETYEIEESRYEYPGEYYYYPIHSYHEIRYVEGNKVSFFQILIEKIKEQGRKEVRTSLLTALGIDQFGHFKDFKH